MKKKQDSVNNTEMGRRGFLKRTVLASAAICIAPILEKVTAAEKSITGKSPVSATVFPVSIAAVRTQRTLGSGKCLPCPLWASVAWGLTIIVASRLMRKPAPG